jgi:hypothetical protein
VKSLPREGIAQQAPAGSFCFEVIEGGICTFATLPDASRNSETSVSSSGQENARHFCPQITFNCAYQPIVSWRVLGKCIDPSRYPPLDEAPLNVQNVSYFGEQRFNKIIVVESQCPRISSSTGRHPKNGMFVVNPMRPFGATPTDGCRE